MTYKTKKIENFILENGIDDSELKSKALLYFDYILNDRKPTRRDFKNLKYFLLYRKTESAETWIDLLKELRNYNKDSMSINVFKIRYGKFWESFYNNRKKDSSHSLQNLIEKYGKDIGEEKYKKFCSSAGKNTKLSYYLSKGMSEEEAKDALKKRQTTFSLERCIEKYGEDEGRKRFEARQQKWQEALNSKSEEEKKEIRRKKGLDKNGNPHKGGITFDRLKHDKTLSKKDCFIYLLFNKLNKKYKIGITTRKIKSRFGKDYLNTDLIFIKKSNTINCLNLEQELLKKYSEFRCFDDILKTTEALKLNNKNLNMLIEDLNEKTNNANWTTI